VDDGGTAARARARAGRAGRRPTAVWVAGAPPAGLAVFPGADYGLFVADPAPGVDRTSQLAPGFLPMLGAFLRSLG
jgi:hypothetical protein